MSGTNAIRDENYVPVALGVSSTVSTETLPFKIDSATGKLLIDGSGISTTLLAVSAASTTAPNSIYNLTAGVPVNFKSSDGNSMLFLDETNERIGIGTASPGAKFVVVGEIAASIAAQTRFVSLFADNDPGIF